MSLRYPVSSDLDVVFPMKANARRAMVRIPTEWENPYEFGIYGFSVCGTTPVNTLDFKFTHCDKVRLQVPGAMLPFDRSVASPFKCEPLELHVGSSGVDPTFEEAMRLNELDELRAQNHKSDRCLEFIGASNKRPQVVLRPTEQAVLEFSSPCGSFNFDDLVVRIRGLLWRPIVTPATKKATQRQPDTRQSALEWCSGCESFGRGGAARRGWLRVAAPFTMGKKEARAAFEEEYPGEDYDDF